MLKKLYVYLFILLITIIISSCNTNISEEDKITKIENYINNYYDKNNYSGYILIANQGEILYENGYGMADYSTNTLNERDTVFEIGSITKQFTAVGILMLEERGLLSVHDKIIDYIPNFPNGENISIHHLLSMSSGISNDVKGIIPEYDVKTNTFHMDEDNRKDEYFTKEQLINLFKDLPVTFEPGGGFEYSNSNYVILGYIIEKVSGMNYDDFIKENIMIPLEMNDSGSSFNKDDMNIAKGYLQINPQPVEAFTYDMSIFNSFGGLYSTAEDLFKWDQALYTNKLLDKDTLDKVFTPHTRIKDSVSYSYGYGWLVHNFTEETYAEHDGVMPGAISYIFHSEKEKQTIIILSNNMNNLSTITEFRQGLIRIINN